jgi:beta-1,4-mannosyl-glycoprotein beta-1,4-N-acetylglucosaminyltransferase
VKPRYWVPFMFRNELDILDCLLYEHYDRVHRFVLAEAAFNHQGRPKPLVYQENRERYAQYADKIIHVVVPLAPRAPDGQPDDPWVRERAQRDACLPAMLDAGARDDDIVVNVDVDEIPSALALSTVPGPICGLMLRYHPFAVDYQGSPGANGVMALVGLARMGSLSQMRQMKDVQPPPYPVIDPGGWHLSWLGGQAEIREKLFSYCHLETFEDAMAANDADVMYGQGKGSRLAAPGMAKVEVDETWPRWIFERKCPASWFRPR